MPSAHSCEVKQGPDPPALTPGDVSYGTGLGHSLTSRRPMQHPQSCACTGCTAPPAIPGSYCGAGAPQPPHAAPPPRRLGPFPAGPRRAPTKAAAGGAVAMATRPPWQLGPGLAAHKAAPQRSVPAARHGLRQGTQRGPPAPRHSPIGIPEGFITSSQPRRLPPGCCEPRPTWP